MTIIFIIYLMKLNDLNARICPIFWQANSISKYDNWIEHTQGCFVWQFKWLKW